MTEQDDSYTVGIGEVKYDRVTVEKYLESNGSVNGQAVLPADHNNVFAPTTKDDAQNISKVAEDARARFSY